jgi:cellulose biosynthesis protein BcsE
VRRFKISGLGDECTQLQTGSLYAIFSPVEKLSIQFALHCINESNDTYFILSDNIFDFFNSKLTSHPQITENYNRSTLFPFTFESLYISENKEEFIGQVLNELSFYKEIKNSTVIIHFPEFILEKLESRTLIQSLHQLKKFAKQKNVTLLFLFVGESLSQQRAILQNENDIVSGLVTLDRDSLVQTACFEYWRHQKGITSNKHFYLKVEENKLLAEKVKSDLDESVHSSDILDLHEVYICEKLVPEGTILPPLYHRLPDNESIFKRGYDLKGATLVFAVSKYTDLKVLAKKCYQLRKHCGKWMKIVIKNIDSIIRHQDECLFLTSGVNLIWQRGTSISLVISQIQAIQGFQFTKNLPHTYADLDLFNEGSLKKGYLAIPDFIDEIKTQRKTALSIGVNGVLVILRVIDGIDPIHALRLFNIKREGDFFTASNSDVYLYLHACRENDVNQAFSHIFRLEISDFFSTHIVVSHDIYIQEKGIQLLKYYEEGNAPIYTSHLNEKIDDYIAHPEEFLHKKKDFIAKERPSAIPFPLTLER